MYCSACGQPLDGARFCGSCGTPAQGPESRPVPTLGQPAAPSRPGLSRPGPSQPVSFRLDRLTVADVLVVAFGIVAAISIVLPWYSAGIDQITISVSGVAVHGWLYLVLVLAIAIAGYLVATALVPTFPPAGVPRAVPLLVAAGLDVLLMIAGLVDKPAGIGWSIGPFLGLVASLLALASAATPYIPSVKPTLGRQLPAGSPGRGFASPLAATSGTCATCSTVLVPGDIFCASCGTRSPGIPG